MKNYILFGFGLDNLELLGQINNMFDEELTLGSDKQRILHVWSGLLYWAGIVSGLDKTMQCLMKNLTIASIVLGWCSICWDRYDRWYWTDISYSLVLGWS